MADVLDEIIAATTPTDPDAPSGADLTAVHRARCDEWKAFVDRIRDRIDTTAEGRRLRRALERSKASADRLVRAHLAVQSDIEAIREAAEAMRERGGPT